tara:strand:+ start:846 stop:1889 length:1044 start_codon:yes stop_codon:yes gene_type:complete
LYFLNYKLYFTLFLVFIVQSIAFSHHSRSYFSEEIYEVEGELIDFTWGNPHIRFKLSGVDSSGQPIIWDIEAGSIYMLQRTGLSQDLFEIGSNMKFAGRVSTLNSADVLATNVLLQDGTEAIIIPTAQPRWPSDNIGGLDQWETNLSELSKAKAENRGIFRVWSIPDPRASEYRSYYLPFKEEAILARESWDPVDNWAVRCVPPGMPSAMNMNPHPIEFTDKGDIIELFLEENAILRTIYLDQNLLAEQQPFGPLGFSSGFWQDQNTLVVETSRIDFPNLDRDGTPQSKNILIHEIFTISDDQSRLSYRMTINEPLIFTDNATIDIYWLALGEQVEPSICNPSMASQ